MSDNVAMAVQDLAFEFERIFSKFASAERVTGLEGDEEDEDEAGVSGRREDGGDDVKVWTLHGCAIPYSFDCLVV